MWLTAGDVTRRLDHCGLLLWRPAPPRLFPFFFFTDTAPTVTYTLSLHDALPIFDELDPFARRGGGGPVVPLGVGASFLEIGRAHVLTPVTWPSRMPSSA